MKCKRGDVVLLDYPFTNPSGSKVRPALVVQGDAYNAKLNSTIVALITKNISRAANEPSQLLIDIATPEGKATGLKAVSAVACNYLYTVHERHILKIIGQFSTTLMQQIDRCLKTAMDLR